MTLHHTSIVHFWCSYAEEKWFVRKQDLRFCMTSVRSLFAFIKIDAALVMIIFDISLHTTTPVATYGILA